ncbi:MAG: MFS transporter [Deltaproteobacteria bacterium]|nr:MFS transporter [Deltaproteobacteria bacterium]
METSSQRDFNLRILLILSLGHLVTDIYQGVLPAILPFLKTKLSLSYALTGAVMMAANLASSVVQPLFGYLSDKKGKAFLLPLGCLTAGIGMSLISVPSSYAMVLALVVISGLGVASFHPEGYKTARFFTGDKMATGMSVFSVGGNLGFAIGPVIAVYIVTHLGFEFLPVIVFLSLLFLFSLLFAWKTIQGVQTTSKPLGIIGPSSQRGAYSALFLLIATVIMRSWTQLGLMAYLPFYYMDYLGGDALYAGKLVSVFLLGGVVGTIGGSYVADRWGHKKYLIATLGLSSLFFPFLFQAKGILLFLALGVFGMVLISSFTVTIVMAQQLLPHNLGVASGLMVGFAIGTGGLGVTVLGIVADHFGVATALKSINILPVMGFLLAFLIKYPSPTESGK